MQIPSMLDLSTVEQSSYPEGPLAAAIEAQIEKSLPVIAGLHQDTAPAERQQLLENTQARQLKAFVAEYGSAFGDERRAEPRGELMARAVDESSGFMTLSLD